MENGDSFIVNILNTFNGVTSKPESFISAQKKFGSSLQLLLKQTYDFTKKVEPKLYKSNALPELIIKNFDLEQIWQQIELQNGIFLDKSVFDTSKLAIAKDRLIFDDIRNDEISSGNSISSNDDDASLSSKHSLEYYNKNGADAEELELLENGSDENFDNFGDENDSPDESNYDDAVKKRLKTSIVDDKFFKLDEMNNFVISEEKNLSKTKKVTTASDSESEESINMFEGSSENEEADNSFEGNNKTKNPRYKDFFGTKTQQWMENQNRQLQYNNSESDVDDYRDNVEEEENENKEAEKEEVYDNDNIKSNQKSTLELKEERLKMKIKEIEDAAINEKPWQLKGEVTADSRPQNSLLQEVLEFDLISRPAPVITEKTTHILEDVIRQRIKDKVFDDVVRKEKPVDTPLEFKKKLMLDQEKSKESLAQIYEKDYIQQREALNPDDAEKEEKEPQLHKEIKTMMYSLFNKLDALSNFHFTPKPAAPELKVVSNLRAINMEEVAPVAVSDAALLAPEEIKPKVKGDIMGKGERTDIDKNRERRKKKQKQREHAKEKKKRENALYKLRPGLGNKYNKEKAKKMLERVTKETNVDKMDESLNVKSMKSSTAFFNELQEEVTAGIKNKTKNSYNKNSKKVIDAKKMKL